MYIKKDFFIGKDYKKYNFVAQTYGKSIVWLYHILQNMTGFEYPSGYAIIDKDNCIIKNIWAGSYNEYPLVQELHNLKNAIYIDNYEGPERSTRGWINLEQNIIEETFNIKFDEKAIKYLGGFPNTLSLRY